MGLLVTREITPAMISTMADRMKAQVRARDGAERIINRWHPGISLAHLLSKM
jgi:hypothetical protein